MSKAQHWQHIIEQWRHSGLAQRKFCADNKIKISSFSYWIQKLRLPEPEQNAGFIPLAISPVTNAPLTIQLGSFAIQCPANQLAEVLIILQQRGHIHAAA